ncbi:nitroreductase family deazaflavin-dependent oxidoreductase [Nocardia huaxiensis]|uniref:Nitroreductase family deazaflavin-dependent oxidoreductase n=1 Tax=Nocardia huaxiensis TaxID=2755382 RepID=A0A7D6VGM3_9NOCA|nr:nitroreductase/quinone reductase family protein [Nocardia huaxiensis]QLY29676.1 nitroreductase family deazaflavin-dependent oxidoreductase [Nocardia huaxiensis]
MNQFQQFVIDEFRANSGRVGGMFEGSTLALLTTIGARTGEQRTSPLGFLSVHGRNVVVASAGGSTSNPGWFHNIRKNPRVTVEVGAETYEAIAAIPQGAERDRLFAEIVSLAPGYGEYQAQTTREIPVVVLHRIDPADGVERVKGLGDFVIEVHEWLRGELAALLEQAHALADGHGDAIGKPQPGLGLRMRTHCVEFCAALTKHHTGESMGAFPQLAQRFPGLAPTLELLGAEHRKVARIQEGIAELVERFVPGHSDPLELAAELEVLAAALEAHFAYEEKELADALNTLGAAPA